MIRRINLAMIDPIILFVFLLGIFLVYAAYTTSTKVCPKPIIQYRFIPRTLKEEMENPVKVSEIFAKMFEKPSILAGYDNTVSK